MITNEQLDKIERYAHPKTIDGRTIRRLVDELRAGAANYARIRREREEADQIAADLVLAVGQLGYRVEHDAGAVVLVPLDDAAQGGDA